MSKEIEDVKNGDIFDIGQTVNGVSRFIYFDDSFHYFEERIMSKYEYDQLDLLGTVLNVSGLEDITYLGNIFETTSLKERIKELEEENQHLNKMVYDYGWEKSDDDKFPQL